MKLLNKQNPQTLHLVEIKLEAQVWEHLTKQVHYEMRSDIQIKIDNPVWNIIWLQVLKYISDEVYYYKKAHNEIS